MNPALPIFSIFAACLGVIVGSFLNVVILRLPKENVSIAFPASHCPKCEHPLSWYENIPVVSYVIQLGKCRHCKTTIALQYPIVELLMGILALALYSTYGFSITFGGYFLFSATLLVISYIDLHLQIIPDSLTLPGIIAGIIFSLVSPQLYWLESLLGILLGGGGLYTVAFLYKLLRKKQGMGGGDIKLLAMLGAFLGWQSICFILLVSSITGIIVSLITLIRHKWGIKTRIPFGPFLCFAGICYIFFSEQLFAVVQGI